MKYATETDVATVASVRLTRTRLDMVDAAGRLCQLLGLPRSTGQIYGLLYLAPEPLSLDDIAQFLGISKSSASSGSRQLLGWRVIRQVWVHGARKDYFEIEPDLANLLRAGYTDFIKPRLASSNRRLAKLSEFLDDDLTNGALSENEKQLCAQRLSSLKKFQERIEALLPLVDQMF